jgi:sodium-dependent dicarboxylate transporter 2/3/5
MTQNELANISILFGTNQYSVKNNLTFGLVVCTIGYVLLLVAGATWFHWLGLTPAFSALPVPGTP